MSDQNRPVLNLKATAPPSAGRDRAKRIAFRGARFVALAALALCATTGAAALLSFWRRTARSCASCTALNTYHTKRFWKSVIALSINILFIINIFPYPPAHNEEFNKRLVSGRFLGAGKAPRKSAQIDRANRLAGRSKWPARAEADPIN